MDFQLSLPDFISAPMPKVAKVYIYTHTVYILFFLFIYFFLSAHEAEQSSFGLSAPLKLQFEPMET